MLDVLRCHARKLVVVAILVVAFLCMASIFVPGRLEAEIEAPQPAQHTYSTEVLENLSPLGQVEGDRYTVKFFATPEGPLYSVYDESGAELAVLLTGTQIAERFPDLALPDAHADVPMKLMGTDVGGGNW